MNSATAVMVTLMCAAPLTAQKGGIQKVLTSTDFAAGSPAEGFSIVFSKPGPDATDVQDKTKWHVRVQKTDGSISTPTVVTIDTESFASDRLVTLHLSPKVDPKTLKSAVFTFDAPLSSGTVVPRPAEEQGAFTAANNSKNADIYISGSANPAIGEKPTYSIDSQVNVLWRGADKASGLGFSAAVKTDNRPKADPDSFRWKVRYRRPPISQSDTGYDLSFAGMEFDRKAKVINFITAPAVDRVICRKEWDATKTHAEDANHVLAVFELDAKLGMEFGANLRNAYSMANSPSPGSGAIFRGVPSTAAYLRFNEPAGFKSIELESDYEVRLPARPELFQETRKSMILGRGVMDTEHPLPLLSRQARHHLTNSITFNFSDALGISVQHEFGSVPPAFVFVDHRFQIGLIWKLKQNRALRF